MSVYEYLCNLSVSGYKHETYRYKNASQWLFTFNVLSGGILYVEFCVTCKEHTFLHLVI